MHKKLLSYVKYLNNYYKSNRALYEMDHEPSGSEVIDANDSLHSIIVIARYPKDKDDLTIALCNFGTEIHHNYRLGVPYPGDYNEVLNSDALEFGGSGEGNTGKLEAEDVPWHRQPYSLEITVPALSAVYFKRATDMK